MINQGESLVVGTLNIQDSHRPEILSAALQRFLLADGGIDLLSLQEVYTPPSQKLVRDVVTASKYDILLEENLAFIFSPRLYPINHYYKQFTGDDSGYNPPDSYPKGVQIAEFNVEKERGGEKILVAANIHLHAGVSRKRLMARRNELEFVEREIKIHGQKAEERVGRHNVIYSVQGDFNSNFFGERARHRAILALAGFQDLTKTLVSTYNPKQIEPRTEGHRIVMSYGILMSFFTNNNSKWPIRVALDGIHMKNGVDLRQTYGVETFIDSDTGSDHALVSVKLTQK